MKISAVLAESVFRDKLIKDARLCKQLSIAWRHDHTIPLVVNATLGPNPKPEVVAARWAAMLDQALVAALGEQYGRESKFAEWLTNLYIIGSADWEDISGEGADALADWQYLSQAGYLDEHTRDLNKIKSIKKLQALLQNYRNELTAHKQKQELDKLKLDSKELVLIDNDRYKVSVPLNYGACRTFNMTGHQSTFCTGGSSGPSWYSRYSPEGPLVMVIDKARQHDQDGKWQFHAPTNQIVNSVQQNRSALVSNAERFGKLFPGLMNQIVAAMTQHKDELSSVWPDIDRQIAAIKQKFEPALNNPVDN